MAFPLSLLRPVPHEGMEGGFGGSQSGHPESKGDIVPEAVNHGQALILGASVPPPMLSSLKQGLFLLPFFPRMSPT